MRGLAAFFRVFRAADAEGGLQPRAPFGQMLPHVPEAEKRETQAERPFRIPALEKAIQRRTKIIVLQLATSKPSGALGFVQIGIALFRQHQAIRSVGAPYRGSL